MIHHEASETWVIPVLTHSQPVHARCDVLDSRQTHTEEMSSCRRGCCLRAQRLLLASTFQARHSRYLVNITSYMQDPLPRHPTARATRCKYNSLILIHLLKQSHTLHPRCWNLVRHFQTHLVLVQQQPITPPRSCMRHPSCTFL